MDVPCRMSRWDRHVAESMEMETSFKDVAVSLAPFAASKTLHVQRFGAAGPVLNSIVSPHAYV